MPLFTIRFRKCCKCFLMIQAVYRIARPLYRDSSTTTGTRHKYTILHKDKTGDNSGGTALNTINNAQTFIAHTQFHDNVKRRRCRSGKVQRRIMSYKNNGIKCIKVKVVLTIPDNFNQLILAISANISRSIDIRESQLSCHDQHPDTSDSRERHCSAQEIPVAIRLSGI